MRKLSGAKAVAVHVTLVAVALFLAFGWAVFLPGCGDNIGQTWGNGVEMISEAFCEARYECGWGDSDEIQVCYEGNVESLCERWDCTEQLDIPTGDMFAQCAADLDVWRCGPFLPGSCYAVLELRQ
jgi:hypothetical protein